MRQTLRIAMADFPALLVIGPLQRALRSTAPGLDLVIQPWHGPKPRQARGGRHHRSGDFGLSDRGCRD
ncbi:MAG: hypothetical protein U5N10_02365 [Gemmobacter sp.]|nr:hypothetical protein [Gemmobacter sp.]